MGRIGNLTAKFSLDGNPTAIGSHPLCGAVAPFGRYSRHNARSPLGRHFRLEGTINRREGEAEEVGNERSGMREGFERG